MSRRIDPVDCMKATWWWRSTSTPTIPVPDDELVAANALRAGGSVCLHAGFTGTIQLVRDAGFAVKTVDISELLKAESGLTCSSILLRD